MSGSISLGFLTTITIFGNAWKGGLQTVDLNIPVPLGCQALKGVKIYCPKNGLAHVRISASQISLGLFQICLAGNSTLTLGKTNPCKNLQSGQISQ